MKTSNHLLRRLTAALLAAVLALSIALPVFASDDGDTIYINSVSDLLSLARNCAYDQWSVGKTVILQKDLSLEGMLWEPIPSFSGQFKGNGHTISDLTITGQYSPAGLFGIVEEQGSIESLSVRGVVSVSDSADTTTGGIVGINHGTLINCQFTGVVTGDSEVGGIVGRNEVPRHPSTTTTTRPRPVVTGKSFHRRHRRLQPRCHHRLHQCGQHQHRISGSLSRHRRLHRQDGGLHQQQDGRRPMTTPPIPSPTSPPTPAASQAAPPA